MATQSKGMDTVDGQVVRLLTIRDLAERLAVSTSMAWKLVAFGEIRSIRVGRAIRVKPADLEAYIEGAVRES